MNFAAAYIPFLGAWAAGAFTVLIALGSQGTEAAIVMTVIVLLANGALQQLVQPIAMGAALGIHPLAVLIVTIAVGRAVRHRRDGPRRSAGVGGRADLRRPRRAAARARRSEAASAIVLSLGPAVPQPGQS